MRTLSPLDFISSAPIWTPGALGSNVIQRMDSLVYRESTIAGVPVLNDSSRTGSARSNLQGRALLFDSSNDNASLGARIIAGSFNSHTITGRIKKTANPSIAALVCGEYLDANSPDQYRWCVRFQTDGRIALGLYRSGTSAGGGYNWSDFNGPVLNNGQWYHFAFTISGTTVAGYIDGSVVSLTRTNNGSSWDGTFTDYPNAHFRLGGALYAPNSALTDIRLYSTVKTPEQILAIANQHLDPTNIDRVGILGGWYGNEQAGTTLRDWSGNGRHLTTSGITEATFHATDSGVLWNPANEVGHGTSGGVIVPRNEATPTNDVLGNALAHTGQVPHYATVEVPCVTGDGSAAYVDTGSRLFPATANFSASCWYYHQTNDTNFRPVLSQMLTNDAGTPGRFNIMANSNNGTATAGWLCVFAQGSTSVLASINTLQSATWHYITIERNSDVFTLSCTPLNGSLSTVTQTVSGISIAQNANTHLLRHPAPVLNNGRIADFRITTGGVTRFFPLQDGIGAAGTNRNLSWVGSDGSGGVLSNALVGGTLANVWANRTNVARDWAVQYGGRVSGGVFIPGHISGSNCVDGNAKTLLAGRNCNPNSRINSNPFSVSGLNGTGSSTGIAVGTGRRLVAPANTKFSRSVRVSGFRALDFDGVNDRVITTANGPATSGRMVSLWFRTTATSGGGTGSLISWGDGTLGQAFQIVFGTGGSLGTNAIGLSQWGDAVGQAGWNDGNWHHVVGRNNGQLWELWVDGVLRASKTMTTSPTAGTIRIGGNGQSGTPGANYNYTGQLDDIRVFATAGTNEQIATLFANRAGAAIGGEILWICPTRDRDGFRTLTARDLIGSNHATLTNMDAESDWIDETETMDDRFFTVRTALTGTDLTKAEAYVS